MAGTSGRRAPEPRAPGFHRAVLEHVQDLVTVLDPGGRVVYASPAMRRLLGYEPEERVGRSILELVHPDDLAAGRDALVELAAEPGRVTHAELRVRHRDGSWRVLRGVGMNLVDDPTIHGILVTAREVTELREAQSELDRTRELLQEVVSQAPIVLWKVDADGVIELSEGRGLMGLGFAPGEVVGQSVFDLYSDDPKTLELVRRALSGEAVEGRVDAAGRMWEGRIQPIREGNEVVGAVGVNLDVTEWAREAERAELHSRLLNAVGQAVIATDAEGRVIYWNDAAEDMFGWSRAEALGADVTDLTVPAISARTAAGIMERLRAGERWAGEYTVQRKDGSTFPIYVTDVPVFEGEELVAMIGVSTDLTEQKELEMRLRQAQKMEAVGRLAGGIAHDFNNLLTTIGGYAALAADRVQDSRVSADIREIVDATQRARGLADKLLAFSRQSTARLEPIDLNSHLEAMLAMLQRLVGASIQLELDTTACPWLACADPALAEQAVINLVLNARDAMPEGGVIELATERVTLDVERAAELGAQLVPGDYMRLTVEDTGQGMEPNIRERIFEPFFTTKPVGEGQGLGLSLVFGAVKQAGGGATVESEPGVGSRVSLFFPRVAEPGRQAPGGGAAHDSGPASGGRGTVLVVEDEAPVLALVRRVLARHGFRVVEATTGTEARRLIKEADEAVDLIVTDVIMPEMSGPELIQRIREENPNARSLFMSGYAADELESRGLSRDDENFLAKPFTPADLLAAVLRALAD